MGCHMAALGRVSPPPPGHTQHTSMDDVPIVQVLHAAGHVYEQPQQQIDERIPGIFLVQQPRSQRLTKRAVAPFLDEEPANAKSIHTCVCVACVCHGCFFGAAATNGGLGTAAPLDEEPAHAEGRVLDTANGVTKQASPAPAPPR